MCLFSVVPVENRALFSSLDPLCSTRSLLFFFGCISPKSSSSQSSARYSSSGTRADVLLVEAAGVQDNCGCVKPCRRDLALPRPRMALWYSSRANTDGAGASRMLSRPVFGTGPSSLVGRTSFRLKAVGVPVCLSRTG